MRMTSEGYTFISTFFAFTGIVSLLSGLGVAIFFRHLTVAWTLLLCYGIVLCLVGEMLRQNVEVA